MSAVSPPPPLPSLTLKISLIFGGRRTENVTSVVMKAAAAEIGNRNRQSDLIHSRHSVKLLWRIGERQRKSVRCQKEVDFTYCRLFEIIPHYNA